MINGTVGSRMPYRVLSILEVLVWALTTPEVVRSHITPPVSAYPILEPHNNSSVAVLMISQLLAGVITNPQYCYCVIPELEPSTFHTPPPLMGLNTQGGPCSRTTNNPSKLLKWVLLFALVCPSQGCGEFLKGADYINMNTSLSCLTVLSGNTGEDGTMAGMLYY